MTVPAHEVGRAPGVVAGVRASALGWSGMLALAALGFWIIAGMFAPLIAPYGQSEIISNSSFLGIGQESVLGTDYLGRDVLSRLLYGARTTLFLAAAATAIAFLTGVIAGTVAGVLGGRWDMAMSRVNDVFFGFPQIMLALVIISALGPSYAVLILTVGFIEGTRVYRIARALAQTIMTMDFVQIARARGERLPWVVWNEVLPNAVAPLATDLGLRFTYAILLLSSLSFLGLGVQPPTADWGMMVRENLTGLYFGAPAAFLSALAIFSVTLSVNHLVDLSLSRMHREISDEVRS